MLVLFNLIFGAHKKGPLKLKEDKLKVEVFI